MKNHFFFCTWKTLSTTYSAPSGLSPTANPHCPWRMLFHSLLWHLSKNKSHKLKAHSAEASELTLKPFSLVVAFAPGDTLWNINKPSFFIFHNQISPKSHIIWSNAVLNARLTSYTATLKSILFAFCKNPKVWLGKPACTQKSCLFYEWKETMHSAELV